MVRFQRQPPGTAITRAALLIGAAAAPLAAALVVGGDPVAGGATAALSAILLLAGGHRANHGAGGPVDRALTEFADRLWDGAVFGSIIWVSVDEPGVAAGALVALCASFLSSYVRAKGASLGYSVEESHVTRGIRYGLVSLGLVTGALAMTVWAAAILSVIAALVRTTQVAHEERA
jgi:hypothetical protein